MRSKRASIVMPGSASRYVATITDTGWTSKDAEPITRTLMVTDPYEFRELLSGQSRDLFVQGVNLLTPKELNGSKGWKVEQLIEASSITWYESEVKHYGFSYQVEDDKCYQDVPREYVESAQYVETIYSELRDLDPDLVG